MPKALPRRALRQTRLNARGLSAGSVIVMYYVYVLLSKKDQRLYIGFSRDLEKRIIAHQRGKIKATKSRCPFGLIYYEACLSYKDARKRENSLKTGYGRGYLKRRLKNFFEGV